MHSIFCHGPAQRYMCRLSVKKKECQKTHLRILAPGIDIRVILQSGPKNPSVNFVFLYGKTKAVGPYSGGSAIVTLASTISIAQICVHFDQNTKSLCD